MFVPAVLVSSFFSVASTDSSVSAVLLQKKIHRKSVSATGPL